MFVAACISSSIVLLATIGWLYLMLRLERLVRARLGDSAREFRIHRRWVPAAQAGLALLLLAIPVAEIIRGASSGLGPERYIPGLLRAIWIGGLLYGNRRASIIVVGDAGFAQGGKRVTPWSDVEEIAWDRDIGQRQWGMTIAVRRGGKVEKMRFYFHRDVKANLEPMMDRLHAASEFSMPPSSRMPSRPSPAPLRG